MVGLEDHGARSLGRPRPARLGRRRRRPLPGGRRSRRRSVGTCAGPRRPGRRGWRCPRSARLSTWASVFAVSTPTRRPVNSPGPIADGDAADPVRGRRPTTRGAARSAGVDRLLRALPAIETLASTSRRVPMATLVCGVDVSMPTTITDSAVHGDSACSRRSQRSTHVWPARRERPAAPRRRRPRRRSARS